MGQSLEAGISGPPQWAAQSLEAGITGPLVGGTVAGGWSCIYEMLPPQVGPYGYQPQEKGVHI